MTAGNDRSIVRTDAGPCSSSGADPSAGAASKPVIKADIGSPLRNRFAPSSFIIVSWLGFHA
jgi:hypothetical protein